MHNLEIRNGVVSMAYNSQNVDPWHGLGTAVQGAMTAAEAMQLSHQDWFVVRVANYARNPVKNHLRSGRVSDDKAAIGYTPERARLESALFGSGDALKTKALDVILTDTAGNPVHSVETFQARLTPVGWMSEN